MHVERLVAVDWSGDKGPGQRKKIWAGVWTRGGGGTVCGGRVRLESGRTREELIAWLIGMARETPAMVVSIDCCFSYPAWFLREHGCATVFDFWRHVAAGHGERWLCSGEDERFWGRRTKRPAQFSGVGYARMMRATDMENKVEFGGGDDPTQAARAALMKGIQPKSPFQIGGSGSVGTGSLRAMEWLLRLWEHGFRVWPFEDAAEGRAAAGGDVYAAADGAGGEVECGGADGVLAGSEGERRRALCGAAAGGVGRARGAVRMGSMRWSACWRWCVGRESLRGCGLREDAALRLEGITWRPGVMG